jgi:arabinofuranosyltransferase
VRATGPGARSAGLILRAAVLLNALLLAVAVLYVNRRFYHDDAYITLRYARNSIAGLGMVWNPGEYVQGYTNFLHLILVSLLGRLGVDLVLASRIVGFGALAGLLVLMTWFGRRVGSEIGPALSYLPAMLVATSVPMLVWSLGGLEGTLFSLLVGAGCLLFLVAGDSSRTRWLHAASGIALGLGFLTRPDGAVFISVTLVWLAWLASKRAPHALSGLVAHAAGVAIVVAPYLVWQLYYYGTVVPNTFYAKTGTPLLLSLRTGSRYVMDYAVRPPFLPVLLVASLAYAYLRDLWSPKLTYLTVSVSAYVAFIVLVGGDHMQSFRLLLPVMPLMSVMLPMALSPTIRSYGHGIAACVTLVFLIATSLQAFDRRLNPQGEDPAAREGTIVGKYIAQAWPAGSLVALNTAGSTPYFADSNRYIDMLGLNDPTIARRDISKIKLPWQRIPGHLKGDGLYVLSRRPDFIIIGPADGRVSSRPQFLSDLELNENPRFHRDYGAVSVSLDPEGQRIPGGGLIFTYYRREGARPEAR